MKRIFVTGMFRSGTTLVARALNAHPAISFASDPYFELFKFVRGKYYAKHLVGFDLESPLSDKFLEDNDFNSKFLDDFLNLNLDAQDLAEAKRRMVRAQEQYSPKITPMLEKVSRSGTVREVLGVLLSLIPKAYPTKTLQAAGFKEVWLDEFIKPLLEDDFYVIQIVRDPRAVIASNKKSATGRYPILFLIRQWRKSVAYGLINRKQKNFLQIGFEDLVQNPEEQFRKIFDFLGIDFSENLIDFAKFKDGAGQPWHQNSSYGKTRKFNPDVIDKWREVLSEDEIRLIEILCEPEMRSLGYEASSQDLSLQVLSDFEESQTDLADWIKAYDFSLNPERKQQETVRLFVLLNPEMDWEEDVLKKLFIDQSVYSELKTAV